MMLTIFTPTYNRGNLLHRLYRSLCDQSCYDFEWLIIDDGSSDDTQNVVQTFLAETRFPVRYFRKENGGKHTAYNYALDKANGDWFLCVDADDFLHVEALARIDKVVRSTEKNTGIIAYKEDTQGHRLSDSFPADIGFCKISDLTLRYNCPGEFTLVFPTQIASQFRFPEYAGEKFIGESVVYDRIDQEHCCVLLPEVITVCEYQPDGYSSNFSRLMQQNPSGFCLYFLQRIDLQTKLLQRIIHAGKYWCFRWICGRRELRYSGTHKLLVALSVVPGIAFRIYYKLFRNI